MVSSLTSLSAIVRRTVPLNCDTQVPVREAAGRHPTLTGVDLTFTDQPIRGRPQYDIDKTPKSELHPGACHKEKLTHRRTTGGVFSFFCRHQFCYGYPIHVAAAESVLVWMGVQISRHVGRRRTQRSLFGVVDSVGAGSAVRRVRLRLQSRRVRVESRAALLREHHVFDRPIPSEESQDVGRL